MVCPRCGHHMTNDEANFCGRCGGPLRARAILPTDDDEIVQVAPGTIPEHPDLPRTPHDLQQAHDDDPLPTPLDPGATGMLPLLGEQPLLRRAIIAAPWQESALLTPPMVDAPTAFEAILPPLSEQVDPDWAAVEPLAAGDPEVLPQDAVQETAEPATMPIEAQDAAPGGDLLRVGGCTVHVSGGPAPLVEVRLEPGAVLTMAAKALVWMEEQVAVAALRIAPGHGGDLSFEVGTAYLQAVGPGELALAGVMAATVTPLELRPGATIELAEGAALAWTRGVRAWRLGRPGSFPAMRLTTDRSALVLLRCSGSVQSLDLEPGSRLTVSPRALLATIGGVDCARLSRHRGDGSALVDYRLIGPGRILLGARALWETGA